MNEAATPADCLDAACALAPELSQEAHAALVAAWPKNAPPAPVVAHLLAAMLADVHGSISKGFVRMRPAKAPRAPKPPAPDAP